MNQTATSATTTRQKSIRTDPITTTQMIDLTTPAPTTKTTRSPTKSAIQALEGITASLPSSLHPLALHFGNKLISIRSKRITKENIAKRMAKEANYIPKSAKATDFKITLSKGASEDSERVSFLEQQIQQAKDTYESSLKNVIEECISLETSALQSQENETIYTLLASITEAINTLEGLKTDVHQKVISLIYLDCSFISYTTSTSRDSFISSYCTHHNLETIPTPTIHPLSITHASANERDTELLLHTKSLERHENNGLQTFRKAIEGIIIAPSVSYEKQIDRSEQAATTVHDKLKQQFGFVADPNKTLLHNASTTLAHTPTWYYFSRPSHLAFHDFTRSKQPAKNLRSLLGLGLKFIPTPRYTNTWKKLRELSMPKFTRAIHLRFHFAGTNTTQDDTYDPKIYVRSNWTPPHWTMPPVVMTKRLENFSNTLGKLFKKRIGKTNLLPYQTRALQLLQQQQDFLVCPCDKNLGPAIIERDDYIKIAMKDHLLDGRTY